MRPSLSSSFFLPVLFRYLILDYFKIFSLCIFSFVSLLFVFRFKEIAQFAILSEQTSQVVLFALYQVPLILPIALPISAMIASFLLFQRLSHSQEIHALRALGCSFKFLFAPLLFISSCLGLFHWTLLSDIAPYCKRQSKEALLVKTTQNPLLLLEKKYLSEAQTAYLSMQSDAHLAKNFLLITPSGTNHSLSCILAPRLSYENQELQGRDVSILSYLPSQDPNDFDTLVIENQKKLTMNAKEIRHSLQKESSSMDANVSTSKTLALEAQEHISFPALVELMRRAHLAFAVVSFTLLGGSFALNIPRYDHLRKFPALLSLFLLIILAFFITKNLKTSPWTCLSLIGLSHFLVWSFSIRRIQRISRGAV